MDSQEICIKCGKAKKSDQSGSITQYLSLCSCDMKLEEDALKLTLDVCAACGKRIQKGRAGSMTQFVFRSDLCSCDKPLSISQSDKESENKVKPQNSKTQEPEEELELEFESFPYERYKPIELLGKGSSGQVYLAKDRILKKKVAVKILHVLNNEQLISFQEEAKSTSKLDHPNIIRILDFGATESGSPYMTLEYFNGVTLEEHIQNVGVLDWQTAKLIFAGLCEALSYAHSQGIYHRDLKPNNILLSIKDLDSPEVRLIDFGLAKVSELTGETTQFQGRTLAGTPFYMSPDVAQGLSYSQMSEVYSLGCILFESLVGQPPFKGSTALETLSMHANEQLPAITELYDIEVPQYAERLISKCLEKDPKARFSSIDELAKSLNKSDNSNASESPLNNDLQHSEKRLKFNPIVVVLTSIILLVTFVKLCIPWLYQKSERNKKTVASKVVRTSTTSVDSLSDAQLSTEVFPISNKEKPGLMNFDPAQDLFKSKVVELPLDCYDKALSKIVINNKHRQVHIDSDNFTGTGFKFLKNYRLKFIELVCPKLNDTGVSMLKDIRSLSEIDVSYINNLTPKGYSSISQINGLSKLHIKSSTIPKLAFKKLKNSTTLNSLILTDCKLADETDIKFLSKLSPLVYLRMSNTNISSTGFSALAKITQLQILSLRGYELNRSDVLELENLEVNTFRLSSCTLSDENLVSLAKIKSLKTMYIQNPIGTTFKGWYKFKRLRPDVTLDTSRSVTPADILQNR